MFSVVFVNEVLIDGPGLPNHEASVWVLYSRNTAVWVQINIRRFLELSEVEELGLIGDVQLLA